VTRWGLSDRLGPLAYGEEEGEVFLGRSVTTHKNVSDDTAHAIDEEIRAFVDRNYERARTILEENMDKLHAMAEALIKYETIDKEQISDIMAGKSVRPPADWTDSGSDSGSDSGTAVEADDAATKPSKPESGSIGGPASQH
jgi:cell division protease FtsH